MNKGSLFWVAVFVGGFLLLVGIPLGIRSVMDAIPRWQKKAEARRVIAEREREERRVVAEKESQENSISDKNIFTNYVTRASWGVARSVHNFS